MIMTLYNAIEGLNTTQRSSADQAHNAAKLCIIAHNQARTASKCSNKCLREIYASWHNEDQIDDAP